MSLIPLDTPRHVRLRYYYYCRRFAADIRLILLATRLFAMLSLPLPLLRRARLLLPCFRRARGSRAFHFAAVITDTLRWLMLLRYYMRVAAMLICYAALLLMLMLLLLRAI